MGSVEVRAAAAWLGAWEFGIASVARDTQINTWLELKERWPSFVQTVHQQDGVLAAQTGKPAHTSRWSRRIADPAAKRQRELVAPAVSAAKTTMMASLDTGTRHRIEGGATTEARAWLHAPVGEDPMPDAH